MLFTEQQLRTSLDPLHVLDQAVYLSEAESTVYPSMVPVVENNRLQSYVIDFNGIKQLSESTGLDYIDSIVAVAESDGIDLNQVCIAIDESELIETPELVNLGAIVVRPLSELDEEFQFCLEAIDAYLDTNDDSYLDILQEVTIGSLLGDKKIDEAKKAVGGSASKEPEKPKTKETASELLHRLRGGRPRETASALIARLKGQLGSNHESKPSSSPLKISDVVEKAKSTVSNLTGGSSSKASNQSSGGDSRSVWSLIPKFSSTSSSSSNSIGSKAGSAVAKLTGSGSSGSSSNSNSSSSIGSKVSSVVSKLTGGSSGDSSNKTGSTSSIGSKVSSAIGNLTGGNGSNSSSGNNGSGIGSKVVAALGGSSKSNGNNSGSLGSKVSSLLSGGSNSGNRGSTSSGGSSSSSGGMGLGMKAVIGAGIGGAVAGGLLAYKQYRDKPKSVIAKRIAALRQTYSKFMAKAQKAPNDGIKNKLKHVAAKILQVIDKLMSFLQRKADGR